MNFKATQGRNFHRPKTDKLLKEAFEIPHTTPDHGSPARETEARVGLLSAHPGRPRGEDFGGGNPQNHSFDPKMLSQS